MAGLDTPLTRLLPADVARKLTTHRQIVTAGELLWFLPRRYLDLRTDVTELVPGSYAVFTGTVVRAATRPMRNRRGRMLNATVRSGADEIDLTFFSAYGHEHKLVAGASGLFAGTVSEYGRRLQLAHPAYQMLRDDTTDTAGDLLDDVANQRYMPVYREVKNLPSWTIARAVTMVLEALVPLEDPLPEPIRARRGLAGLGEAFALVHAPPTLDERGVQRGLARLRYDEALTLQVVLAQRRLAHQAAPAVPRRPRPGGLLQTFDARLPFTLTEGQRAVGEQIADDLARTWPMHRLLQGEVGSGKTVVALRAMLAVVDAGGQAALLAPTEVLAAQHHRSITAMLGDLAEGGLLGGSDQGTRVALLTGGQSAAQRRAALLQAASGEAGIVVGTHALIQDRVQFADLGLVVVDEQHRFGVAQRDALRGKAQAASSTDPHVLVMTATPIPRTVAMTVFGDMDTSVLAELPAGRSPIASYVVGNPSWYERAWERVAEEVSRGHQAYVVCPRIGDDAARDGEGLGGEGLRGLRAKGPDGEGPDGEGPDGDELDGPGPDGDGPAEAGPGPGTSDDTRGRGAGADPGRGQSDITNDSAGDQVSGPARSVLEVRAELGAHPALSGLRIEILHGRLPADAKDAVMAAFGAGEIDVLVSTTVIEVGVDVPNATVMVVMDADRFGVSQLHQLRGRVGRGSAPGLCLLVTGSPERTPNPAAVDRLAQVAATLDGFELARLDLEQRREGDVLGARQSGAGSLRLLRLNRDEAVIADARADAADLVGDDPQLSAHPALARAAAAMLDEEQAAYLERG